LNPQILYSCAKLETDIVDTAYAELKNMSLHYHVHVKINSCDIRGIQIKDLNDKLTENRSNWLNRVQ